ncbi:ATP-binding cassette domain-containing protein [Limosilactobacillus fermentum]|nr:ATP-binding cassette domain-containing protein [Limosilactobacillus fermentum]
MTLSGGQQQLVWLAAALNQDAQAIFLDEPTTYLDLHFQVNFLKLLQRIQAQRQRRS